MSPPLLAIGSFMIAAVLPVHGFFNDGGTIVMLMLSITAFFAALVMMFMNAKRDGWWPLFGLAMMALSAGIAFTNNFVASSTVLILGFVILAVSSGIASWQLRQR